MDSAARPGVEHGWLTLILRGLSPEHRSTLGLLSKSLREPHPKRVTGSGRLTIRPRAARQANLKRCSVRDSISGRWGGGRFWNGPVGARPNCCRDLSHCRSWPNRAAVLPCYESGIFAKNTQTHEHQRGSLTMGLTERGPQRGLRRMGLAELGPPGGFLRRGLTDFGPPGDGLGRRGRS